MKKKKKHLESKSPIILSNVIGLVEWLADDLKIRLYNRQNDSYDFDDISNMQLSHLQFTFLRWAKLWFWWKACFLVSYKISIGYPNKYAVRGFDITYDVLLRLANATSLYDAVDNDTETEYVENKFPSAMTKTVLGLYQQSVLYFKIYRYPSIWSIAIMATSKVTYLGNLRTKMNT